MYDYEWCGSSGAFWCELGTGGFLNAPSRGMLKENCSLDSRGLEILFGEVKVSRVWYRFAMYESLRGLARPHVLEFFIFGVVFVSSGKYGAVSVCRFCGRPFLEGL